MRELLEAAGQGDAGAELAVAMFCYCVRKHIVAYLGVLNSADAILFGGGIGENAPEVRAHLHQDGLVWAGAGHGPQYRSVRDVSSHQYGDATLHTYVMSVGATLIIAWDTVGCLGGLIHYSTPLDSREIEETRMSQTESTQAIRIYERVALYRQPYAATNRWAVGYGPI